eukprot:97184_1
MSDPVPVPHPNCPLTTSYKLDVSLMFVDSIFLAVCIFFFLKAFQKSSEFHSAKWRQYVRVVRGLTASSIACSLAASLGYAYGFSKVADVPYGFYFLTVELAFVLLMVNVVTTVVKAVLLKNVVNWNTAGTCLILWVVVTRLVHIIYNAIVNIKYDKYTENFTTFRMYVDVTTWSVLFFCTAGASASLVVLLVRHSRRMRVQYEHQTSASFGRAILKLCILVAVFATVYALVVYAFVTHMFFKLDPTWNCKGYPVERLMRRVLKAYFQWWILIFHTCST